MSNPLQELSRLGQSVWIDFISRQALESGDLARMVEEDSVVGLTSNPTIFEKAIADGDAYDEQLSELGEIAPEEAFIELAVRDIQGACDLLHPVWERSGHRDGYVSIEVDPTIAHDAGATTEQARLLHDRVGRENVLVKIPATREGLEAIENTIAGGVSVNVTLIFSLERHAEVAEAYLRGLERLRESGGEVSTISSVASFFVSRVDTEGDERLEKAGHPELQGRLAIANARLAYAQYREIFGSERFAALRAAGATPQRCLWASTSTKNPDYRDTIYVEELIGPDTVNTMPEETLRAFADHGRAEVTLEQGVEEAREVFAQLREAGVDTDDVAETLEREGVEKFEASYRSLVEGIAEKQSAILA